jgi:hypothetical protein
MGTMRRLQADDSVSRAGVAVFAVLLACSSESPPAGSEDATGGIDDGIAPTTGDTSGIMTATATGPKLDVGADTGTGLVEEGGEEGGCRHVDVLLSIDNSGSMQEEIEALAGPVFDSFPMALLDVANGLDDFQLGVIDACNNPPFLHDTGDSGPCGYSSGTNYMVSTSPDLLGEYGCVTELSKNGWMGMPDGCSGSNDDEQPANTAADVVSEPAVSMQNAGFVRNDAVLFIVAITDEDEKPVPAATAQEVADKIVAAKGTIDNVVFLGIGGAADCEGPYGGADDAAFLREITTIFVDADRGLFWDLCQGDLEGAFQAALATIDSACEDFVPVG